MASSSGKKNPFAVVNYRRAVGIIGVIGFLVGGVIAFRENSSTLILSMSAVLLVAAYLGERITKFNLKWGDNEASAKLSQVNHAREDVEDAEKALTEASGLTEPEAKLAAERIALEAIRRAKSSIDRIQPLDNIHTVPAPDDLVSDDVTWVATSQSVNGSRVDCLLFYRTSPMVYSVEASITGEGDNPTPDVEPVRVRHVRDTDVGFRAVASFDLPPGSYHVTWSVRRRTQPPVPFHEDDFEIKG